MKSLKPNRSRNIHPFMKGFWLVVGILDLKIFTFGLGRERSGEGAMTSDVRPCWKAKIF